MKFGDQLKITVPRPSAFAAFNSVHKASALPANFTVHKSSIPKPLSLLGITSPCHSIGPSNQRPFPPESAVAKFAAQSGDFKASQLGKPGHSPSSRIQFGKPISSNVMRL